MVLDTSNKNKNIVLLINDLVGKPYSFIQLLKMKGSFSKKMIIADASVYMGLYLNKANTVTLADIELRPLGVLIRIFKGIKTFTWVVPFYQLVLYKKDCNSIHAHGRFLRFKKDHIFEKNKAYFHKLLNQKATYESKYGSLKYSGS
ncbi:hypothetical protein EHW67_09970 [Arenibacter aquaticus]|uniref:Uncharacterized protein n=1 Tax=Arenibacter aquaticus TaxID=2489054 RepID=A0A3S0AE14_9FLAO|nr:hypothetical protein [Arenibacter aquaticus]RTE53347.1 hypothetical protein EHW67_09970 [Arenibacter aquaticus]